VSKLGQRAVVCGAGMGGLLAARVLSDFYDAVTVVERDKLTDAIEQRRGVPQGRHFHVPGTRCCPRPKPVRLSAKSSTGQ